MDFMVDIAISEPDRRINYKDKIMLVGSCFTEHIGKALSESKFNTLQNPSGILFDPASVCKTIIACIENRPHSVNELFLLNEVWHSWDHHSRFSGMEPEKVVNNINDSQQRAHDFLGKADWIILTLGSSFSYRLTAENAGGQERGVANCHRAPGQWFNKHLLSIDSTISMLDQAYHRLMQFNPSLNIIFTVSPVRHLRDGVVENNRSKARLIEAVHHMVNKFEGIYYFPAYELVIDVLRDYRFYDIDMAHPNYQATEFVLEKFAAHFIEESSNDLMKEIRKIAIAKKHRPMQPGTSAHRRFLEVHAEKARMLMEKYPGLDLREELTYFSAL